MKEIIKRKEIFLVRNSKLIIDSNFWGFFEMISECLKVFKFRG